MGDGQYFDIILFALIAVFIGLRLRSVLGRRTGHEHPPERQDRLNGNRREAEGKTPDNIVAMPRRKSGGIDAPPLDLPQEDGQATPLPDDPKARALAETLARICRQDRLFDERQFLDGARAAYEMILSAFAAGDRETLKPLLSPEVFENFTRAIEEREKAGQTQKTELVAIEKAEITDAEIKGKETEIEVRFESEMFTATLDAEGRIIAGDLKHPVRITDTWRFRRRLGSRDPNWKLIATHQEG